MKKLLRNTSDEKSAAFWRFVDETAAKMRDAPAWMKAGIVLNPEHYETFPPVDDDDDERPARSRRRRK